VSCAGSPNSSGVAGNVNGAGGEVGREKTSMGWEESSCGEFVRGTMIGWKWSWDWSPECGSVRVLARKSKSSCEDVSDLAKLYWMVSGVEGPSGGCLEGSSSV